MKETPSGSMRDASCPSRRANLRRAACLLPFAINAFIRMLLVYAGFHVHADRTPRQPIVTWIGPIASLSSYFGYVFGSVVYAAFVSSGFLMRVTRRPAWFVLAFSLSILSTMVSAIFFAALYED